MPQQALRDLTAGCDRARHGHHKTDAADDVISSRFGKLS